MIPQSPTLDVTAVRLHCYSYSLRVTVGPGANVLGRPLPTLVLSQQRLLDEFDFPVPPAHDPGDVAQTLREAARELQNLRHDLSSSAIPSSSDVVVQVLQQHMNIFRIEYMIAGDWHVLTSRGRPEVHAAIYKLVDTAGTPELISESYLSSD